MKRAVICVDNPQDIIPQLPDYSIMVLNPNSTPARNHYLLENSDWSLLITDTEEKVRDGKDYPNERLLWYTSGTTGDSKFCSFSQAQLELMAETICRSYNITANDRYTSIMSLWHAHGQGFYWATELAQCERKFLSAKELRNLPKNNPTFITAIPDILRTIAEFKFDHLRFIRGASAPLPDDVYQQLESKFNIPIIEAFGMTEAMSHCFTNPLDGERRMGTVGLPDGIEANINEGRLYIRGPSVHTTNWVDTGDLAEQDEAGYYRILGRHRDQINVRGVKLNPASIEKQLLENIDGLREVVIFGQDRVKCLYIGECNPDTIMKFLLNLGKHCRPTVLEQVEVIPVTPANKISRTMLSDLF